MSGLSSRPDCSKPAIVQLTRHSYYIARWVQISRLLRCPSRPTIPRMNVREAKNFLVDQAARQAAIDGVPLSDLEKRTMCFTEWDDSGGDPIALNEEFEAQYKAQEYEPKIAELMRHAYARLKKRTPPRPVPGTKLLQNSTKATTMYLFCLAMARANGNCLAPGRARRFLEGPFGMPSPSDFLFLSLAMVVFVYLLQRGDSMPARQSRSTTFCSLAQQSCLYMTSASTKPRSGC